VGAKIKERKRDRLKRHFRRFWICYTIAIFIPLAVGLPVLYVLKPLFKFTFLCVLTIVFRFLIIFPLLVQDIVNKTALPVYYAGLAHPTLSEITVSLSSSIKLPHPFTATLESVNLSLFNRETEPYTPFVTLHLPEQHLKGTKNITVTNQTVRIQNLTEYTKFLYKSVYSENFTLSAKGVTNAKIGSLKAKVKLDKDVILNGKLSS